MPLPVGCCLTTNPCSNCPRILDWLNSKSELCYDRRSVGQSVLVSSTHLGPKTVSCGFVDVGRLLLSEDESVLHTFCRSSRAQSFSGSSPAALMTVFYCLRLQTPPTWRAKSHGGPVIPPGSGFPFRRQLRLAGLRWRYSNLPPRRMTGLSKPKSKLLYDWRFAAKQFVLAPCPLRIATRLYFSSEPLRP
jgi:hypothetical protein